MSDKDNSTNNIKSNDMSMISQSVENEVEERLKKYSQRIRELEAEK